MTKLSAESLSGLDDSITRPVYDREAIRQGIVHIGVGGFHRAHQAIYTEQLLNRGKALEWGICGVGLRPEDQGMRDALAAQDYLYTLYELGDGDDTQTQVVGAIGDFMLAQDDPQKLIEKLSSPETRIVSLTITEGGYCTDDSTGEFSSHLPQIQHDLQHPESPETVFGYLSAALKLRRDRGVTPFTVMSCDNLPHNGEVARKALLTFTGLQDQELARWIEANVCFPNAMVDRITPMTSDEHREQLRVATGIEDRWPVVAEPFIQWVLEDRFCNGRPEWEDAGVQFTDDVTPYEEMKIRLLNGSHLAMTYLGFLLGYRFAHETMEDETLRRYVRTYMDLDVTPTLSPVPGIDLEEYKNTLIERFSNREICDQLSRICSDGSSKFPKFVLPTLLDMMAQGKPLERVALIIAAWAHYLRGVDEKGERYSIPDPRAGWLQEAIGETSNLVESFLGLEDVFGKTIPNSAEFVSAFKLQLERLQKYGVKTTLEMTLGD